MTAHADLAYALARLQARLGARPSDAHWRDLEAAQTTTQALSVTRQGPLTHWLDGVAQADEAAALEQRLRQRWAREVATVAGWLPPRWRAAVHLQGRLAPWPLAAEDTASDDGADRLADWAAAWPRALPADAATGVPWRAAAEQLCPRLRGDTVGRPARSGAAERALVRLFRGHAGTAVPAFAYLALAALDLERLRGALVARAMFETETEAA
ncbi:hypothetical protein [Rubrivivax albus]|uniref:Uncharacterized protein n=1 Tax=Rubrivivax albus TaxID=2499835 RepID=A0A437JXL9_9BURK|nr:hypothetical protein [Rubrivivax albus]RVT52412.1 hypothetical protein ENE75_08210 [Rubrivivax albus]